QLLPSDALIVSLDRLLAFVHAGEVQRTEARVLTDPPPILVSTQRAVLVILDGEPVMMDDEKTGRRRVLNTNWELYQDNHANLYSLHYKGTCLTAADLHGIFPPATPRVFVVNKPSELIVIDGMPRLGPIAGTQLSSVTNTESDLFFHSTTRAYY